MKKVHRDALRPAFGDEPIPRTLVKVFDKVLARSLEELLELLTVGWRRIGMVEEWDLAAKDAETSRIADLAGYRRWVKSDLGIAPVADPRALVARARQAHPDLEEWVMTWVRRRRSGAGESPTAR